LNNKQKYIALLTKGELEQEIIDALIGCGYELKHATNYGGCITNHYEKTIDKNIKCSTCRYSCHPKTIMPCSGCSILNGDSEDMNLFVQKTDLQNFKFILIDSTNNANYKNFSNFGNVCDVTGSMG